MAPDPIRPRLAELSRAAWTLADPSGAYARQERLFEQAVVAGRGDFDGIPDLREHLCALAHGLSADELFAEGPPPRVIALVMTYLAAHPGRPLTRGVLGDAIDEAFPAERVPDDVLPWLRRHEHHHHRFNDMAVP